MEKNQVMQFLKDLIANCLKSDIYKTNIGEYLMGKITPSSVCDYEDDLISDSFFALYHMNEKYCEPSDTELLYLRDCLEGKRKFSRFDRDELIRCESGSDK